MEIDVNDLLCCGIKELNGVSAFDIPKEAIEDILHPHGCLDELDGRNFVLYSTIVKEKRSGKENNFGDRLATYIRRKGYGSVTSMGPQVNPGTGNTLKVYMWNPNYKALQKAQEALKAKLDKEAKESFVDRCGCGDRYCQYNR